MGASSSTSKVSAVSKAQRADGRKMITETAKQNIGAVKKATASTNNNSNNNQIITMGQTLDQMFAVTQVAERQVTRGGDSFTKDDMIAILVLLKTIQTHENWFTRLGGMGSFTREDLVALIRSIVFDPVVVDSIVRSFVTLTVSNKELAR